MKSIQIVAIGTVRNEVDLLRPNLLHHLSQGIDRFILLDNGSTDGTQDLLAALSKAVPLTWWSAHGTFRQNELLTNLARQACGEGATWIMPIDADEFWYARQGTVRAVLQSAPLVPLRVELQNFVQRREQRFNTPGGLLGMTRRVSEPVGSMERAEELVESETIAYVEHRYHYKWIHPAATAMQVGWGNHTLAGAPVSERRSDISCLHAPLRSFAVLQAKVDMDRRLEEIDEYFGIAWHLRRWRRLAWEGRLEEEWRANSYANGCLDVRGRARVLIEDRALTELVEPWLSGSALANAGLEP